MKAILKTYTVPQTTVHTVSGTAPLMASGDMNSIIVDKDETPGNQSQAESRRSYNIWDDGEY